MASPRHLMVVAGEASGDALGAALIRALQAEAGAGIRFSGVGGPLMAAEGHVSLFPMHELSVMGLAEVLPRVVALRRRLLQTVDFAQAERPDALVTIDSPGFTLRLAERLGDAGITRIHYVAPQVWAWRPGRVHHVARVVDHLLALFRFEPPLFETAGLRSTWVGHPLIEAGLAEGDREGFRQRLGVALEAPLLLLAPGSRAGEVARLLPLFRATVDRLGAVGAVVPAVAAVRSQVEAGLAGWPVRHWVVDSADKADAIAACDAALAASGTLTLELSVAGLPAVIAYRVNTLTALAGSLLLRSRYVGLPNILAGREVMPEFLQWRATPAALAGALAPLLNDERARQAQRAAFQAIRAELAPPGPPPSVQAARAVLRQLERQQQ